MSRIAAIGCWHELAGYALAGVDVVDAPDAEAVRAAWEQLADDQDLVLLTPGARRALPEQPLPPERLWVVLPE
jgi:vacuolar-type H+-ATPase subunit F/Vma7